MCPLYPIHLFVMYAFVLGPLWIFSSVVVAQVANKAVPLWEVDFFPDEVYELQINSHKTVQADFDKDDSKLGNLSAISDNDHIAKTGEVVLDSEAKNWTASFNVSGNFIGYANVRLRLISNNGDILKESNPIKVTVIREDRVIDHVFVGSVATLVSIIYINFGCALDWSLVKSMLKRPIGPGIGFTAQFLFMPLLSFGLGKALFPGNAPMQLGMFFTGVSPAGGASNIWTVALEGNVNLSITMTTISTFAAFIMMPFWIFTLGSVIFNEGNIAIPYSRIAGFAFGLVVPLFLGFLIQRYLPRVSKFMVRILKPFAAFLILFIIIFAVITNIYLFELFSWEIIVAGLGLPWIGFMFGMFASWIFKQPTDDILAISVETGVQNTGIAIFLLSALKQPEGDLTTVIPVSVAIMTPIPLMVLFIYRRCWRRRRSSKETVLHELQINAEDEENSTHVPTPSEPFANGSIRKY